MKWYYMDGGQQVGPVSEEQIQQLVQSGVIQSATLVWKEGSPEWVPYSQAVTSAGSSVAASGVACVECGNIFPPDEVIRHGNSHVCATCKPIFVQKLKEGAALSGTVEYAGFWIRFGAKFVDGIILRLAGFVVGIGFGLVAGGLDPLVVSIVLYVIGVVISLAYNTFFVGKFAATPGKMAAKVRVVNADGSPVSYAKAIGRYFAEILSAILLMAGYIMAAFDPEKRALHDRICGTRVIKVTPR